MTSCSGADIRPSRSRVGGWRSVLRGHFALYAVPGNDAPASFFYQVRRRWFRALRRRSQRHRLTWERMDRIHDPMATPRPA